jgi:hypothetical protein
VCDSVSYTFCQNCQNPKRSSVSQNTTWSIETVSFFPAGGTLKKKLVEQTSKWHLRDNHASIYMIYISDPPFPGPVSISVIK